jgi:hypothetical protein
MKTRLTLKPGQSGTKALQKKYGDDLVYVRFRYDPATNQRLKTVEIVVERSEWTPPARISDETLVPLRISAKDMTARKTVKAAGGKWNPEKQLWYVSYGKIVGTSLEKYIDVYGYDK